MFFINISNKSIQIKIKKRTNNKIRFNISKIAINY